MLGDPGVGSPSQPSAPHSLQASFKTVPVPWAPAELAQRKAVCLSSFCVLLGHLLGAMSGSLDKVEQSFAYTIKTIQRIDAEKQLKLKSIT